MRRWQRHPTHCLRGCRVRQELLGSIPILQVGVPAVLSVYFDLFSSFMQAFIFCMLTTLYIANAADDS